jgi:D-alanyl-lipoteichoic acid acyltransferase DltB (MBOAT superfamily)
MAFHSISFLIFFPVVLTAYYLTPFRFRWCLLLAASYFFYMSWEPKFALLLLAATIVSYVSALAIAGSTDATVRKGVLISALVLLLGTLFLYKYFNFFNDAIRALLATLSIDYAVPAINLLLPLGISFFTFQKVAYVVDVYHGKIAAEAHFGRFALFASYFPQLVAGPIERAKNLLPQLAANVTLNYDNVASGLRWMAWGFFKKLVVADHLAPLVNTVYGAPQHYNSLTLTVATVGFAFQVYCDFSAYSDIAIGAARTMGVNLMDNFKQPYFATSIAEFWKRWHISLSTWLTDYVYTPLTRSRRIPLKWYPKFLLSLLLTFLVSGIWHGANWTFIAWGALHGTYLVSSMLTQSLRRSMVRATRLDRVPYLHNGLRMAFTFALVCISYVFFRAANLHDAFYIIGNIGAMPAVGDGGVVRAIAASVNVTGDMTSILIAGLGIAIVLTVDAVARLGIQWPAPTTQAIWVRWPAYYLLILATIVLGAYYRDAQSFIYFQF